MLLGSLVKWEGNNNGVSMMVMSLTMMSLTMMSLIMMSLTRCHDVINYNVINDVIDMTEKLVTGGSWQN